MSDPTARFGVLAVFWAGWGVLLVSIFLLNHFELLIGIWFEERDLVTQFGQRYEVYRQQVAMLFAKLRARDRKGPAQP